MNKMTKKVPRAGFTPTPNFMQSLVRQFQSWLDYKFSQVAQICKRREQSSQHKNWCRGFTLIEILIVIGIIAILAAIVLVAVNPAEQFRKAGDAQRASNVNAILNAVGQYMVDNQGNPPGGIPSGVANAENISDGGADICNDLVPDYIAALPADPEETDQSIIEDECGTGDSYDTGYKIYEDGDRITIVADQGDDDITVTR